ncbi:MAG: flagellar motor switch protein FliN [Deltaproteobacteria bacterium]|jgi:flagellar motor switch protein FliN/FliY|nr:flagellar motor switch protein FliN [Deltaproteobacteria bacterium]
MADEEILKEQNSEEAKAVDGGEEKRSDETKAAEEQVDQMKDEGVKTAEDAKAAGDSEAKTKVEAKAAQFSNVQDAGKSMEQKSIDFILDLPLQVTVELGRTQMLINDLLRLGQGSVVELSKLAGEPMEVLVNQKLVARGEVVVVNDKFGVRLTDVISPLERVEQLR